jgi:transposase
MRWGRLVSRVNEVLATLDAEFSKRYAESGRLSIAPERLLRALLFQAFYPIPRYVTDGAA